MPAAIYAACCYYCSRTSVQLLLPLLDVLELSAAISQQHDYAILSL
jgi:hypothetical protein